MTTPWTLTIDCAHPAELARFWALALGGGRDGVPWEQRWPRVLAAAEKLTAAGAKLLMTAEVLGKPDHLVMADPEGNEFCLV